MEEPTTRNSSRASSATHTVSRRYSKMRPQKTKYPVTTCANIFIASTHMNRGSAYWHSISDSFSYQLAIIKGVIPSSALGEDGGRSESPTVVKVNLFDCGDVGKPVFAAAQFYPGSYSPEDLPPSTDLDRWAAVTAVIITRSHKRQQGQQHADSLAPSSSTLTLTETMAKHDKKSASRWTEVAETVARSRPMAFGNKFLAFELVEGRQWIDGVGLLMTGIVPFAELGSATAVVRAYNSALLFSAYSAKSKIMTEASAVSGSDCEGGNETPGAALSTLTLGTPQVRQGLRAVATKTPKTHLVFSFKEKMSFAPPLGIGLAESRILPPTAISPKKVEARIINTCSLSHHVTCVFFPVTGMDPTNDFAYLALDTWASKASSWLLENTEGRALFDKILEEVPVCGKFLCAAVKTVNKGDPVLGLLLHFHWNPENMKPFYMAVDTAIREAWGALRVSTADCLL